jgi:hypothetical protein
LRLHKGEGGDPSHLTRVPSARVQVSVDQEKSKKIKDMTHSCYDHTARGVMGKVRKPRTSFIGTANIIVNEDDEAFLSRLLLIIFKPLDTTGVDPSLTTVKNRVWTDAKAIMSCLLPDLEGILVDGKLDAEALADCCSFMNAATSSTYSRNANLWGFVLYYMLLIEVMAFGGQEELDLIFDFVCTQVVKQHHLETKHGSSMDQFILALHTCRTSAAANPLGNEASSIHWHNYREKIKPEGFAQLGQGTFIAVRIDSVCHVIHNVMKIKFKPDEIRRAVEDCPYASFSRGKFYNVTTQPWPISKTHFDEATSVSAIIPLPESDLLEGTLSWQRCLFIKKASFEKVIQDADCVGRDAPDYKQIKVQSNNPRYSEAYNFFETVTGRNGHGWFGLRALGYTNFSSYCGADNEVSGVKESGPFVAGMEQMCADHGFPSVDQCFSPGMILEHYGYTEFPDPISLPPPFRINPFAFRNQESDYQMPDDPRSVNYHNGLVDDFDARDRAEYERYNKAFSPSKSRRDDELRSGMSTPDANRKGAGSSLPLGDSTPSVINTPVGGSQQEYDMPLHKRQRRHRPAVVHSDDDEGEDLMDDDEVSDHTDTNPHGRCVHPTNGPLPFYTGGGRGGAPRLGRRVPRRRRPGGGLARLPPAPRRGRRGRGGLRRQPLDGRPGRRGLRRRGRRVPPPQLRRGALRRRVRPGRGGPPPPHAERCRL